MTTGTPDPKSCDAIVIGAGHNGLTTAAYLARAGLRTVVLERRDRVGGAADTTDLAPGVRVPTVAHTVGRLSPRVVKDLDLTGHGLRLVQPEVRVFAPGLDGRAITLWGDAGRTAAELRARSVADADAYPEFDRQVRALGAFLARLLAMTPVDTRSPGLGDALAGLLIGRDLRGLGRADAQTILRALPMAVADFVGEWFEADRLRAVLASRGIQYTAMGPWSGGTAAVLLVDAAGNDGGAAGQAVFARGGPGALAEAIAGAVRAAGGEIRTGVEVAAVRTADGRVTGVALVSGEELSAPVVVSGADPKRTLLDLVDPMTLGPGLSWRAGNLRLAGMTAKVNLGLRALPAFAVDGLEDGEAPRRLRGRIVMAAGIDDLERAFDEAKYGGISTAPYLEATIPSLVDPGLVDESRAGDTQQVMSIVVQYAPYHLREGSWEDRREELGDRVVGVLEAHAPGFTALVTARQVLTPLDLEREYGLTEGHPYHGEPSLDQFFAWRPLLGLARYRLPLDGFYLCGSGAHPGGGLTGQPGANAAREILGDRRRRR